jgi:hypothetical protein
MTVKDLTDDELIARITETYNLTRYGGDVAELVRRYRDSSFRLSRIANEASFQPPPATQVATEPEKPVATPPRGSTGQCGCGAPLDSTGRCTWGPTPRCRMPTTAAGVLELCQRVLDPPARYEGVRALAEWVLTTGLVGRLCPCGSPLDEQGRCPVHTRLMRDVTGKP